MGKKRKRAQFEEPSEENQQNSVVIPEVPEDGQTQDYLCDEDETNQPAKVEETPLSKAKVTKFVHEPKPKKAKSNYTRVQIDPRMKYSTPESRESWGPNVKGKKFRKEKGKKKRCPNAGVRIDGSVKSVRLDA